MLRFKLKTKDCSLTVKVKIPSNINLNERDLDNFSRKLFRGFLKPQVLKKNLIEYRGPIGITLYERLQKPINKFDFFYIIEQIVVSTINLQNNRSPWNNVVWDLQHAFINENTKEVQLIYLPFDNTDSGNIFAFIENIIYSAKPFDEKDQDFISKFFNYIKQLPGYNPEKIENYIKREHSEIVKIIRKNALISDTFITDKPGENYEHYNEKTALLKENEELEPPVVDEVTGLLNEVYAPTERLSNLESTGYSDDEATGLLADVDDTGQLDDEATGRLEECADYTDNSKNVAANVHFPTLHRVLTNEEIYVNKPVFRLGKERSCVDYFVESNVAVSRSHADIITRGEKYYVRDLNSKNHTYVNSQMIPVKVETEIYNGDRIILGNEEFIFYI